MTEPQPVDATMLKYGCHVDEIKFEMDDWALIPPPEGDDGLDCVHACNRQDKVGEFIQWSYTIPGYASCPGCDATMPDEIQGLYQMANMDRKSLGMTSRFWAQEFARQSSTMRAFMDELIHDMSMPSKPKGKITGITA